MNLTQALAAFAAHPSAAPALVAELRATATLYVPFRADAPVLTHGALAAASDPETLRSFGDPRALPSTVVWSMVHARRARAVTLEPAGPNPVTLDLGGVWRITGPPGLAFDPGPDAPPGSARSVAEIHLLLDLFGWPPGSRGHLVRARGADLVATYTWPEAPAGTPRDCTFHLPDPALDPHDLGPGTSRLLDPTGWRCAADLLAPVGPPVSGREKAWEYRFDRAAACLEQALRFCHDPSPHAVPPDHTFATGHLIFRLHPERLRRDSLVAARAACLRREPPS